MSHELLPDLLEECLAAYDAGVAPEECLAAYPTRRAELEPLFRQALSLRISYAASPSAEFRYRARKAMMVSAGVEVQQAFAARPDPAFVKDARAKFMHAAGADAQAVLRAVPNPDPRYVASSRRRLMHAAGSPAQEALRAVPPPRLPFWWNTRRTLLETAAARSMPQPRPQRRPFGSLAFQAGLSMAVVVLAVAAGTLTFLTNGGGTSDTPSAAAQVAELERQLNDIEARDLAGQPISTVEVASLAQRTTDLAEKLKEQPSTASGVSKLPALIERQQNFIINAYANAEPPPEVVQVQQQLDKAAAGVQPTPVATLAAATSTAVPQVTATAPAATVTATVTPVPAPLQQGQVRIGLLAGDTFGGLTWQEIRTSNARIVAPSNWQVANTTTDANGVARLLSNSIVLNGDQPVLIDVEGPTAGQILAIINGQIVTLRGSDGKFISPDELLTKAGSPAPLLRHMLDSFDISAPVVIPATPTPVSTTTPTPTPVATNTPVATSIPAATNTPAGATPTRTATPRPPTQTPTPRP